MRSLKYILFFSLLISPVLAEQKKAMNYIVPGQKKAQSSKPSTLMRNLRTRQAEEPLEDLAKKAANQAWETYKALAMGQDHPTSSASATPSPSAQKIPSQKTISTPAAGLAGLLQEYQNSKIRRSQMNSLVVNPRSAP